MSISNMIRRIVSPVRIDSSQSPHLTSRVRTQNRSPRAVRFTLETENPNVARPKQTAAAKRKIVFGLTGYPPLVRAIVPLRRQSRPMPTLLDSRRFPMIHAPPDDRARRARLWYV